MNTYYIDATISVEANSIYEAAEQVSKLINLTISAREDMELEYIDEPELTESVATTMDGVENE